MYDDPSRRDTDVERTIIEGAGMPPQYPPTQPPPPQRDSGFPLWMLALGGIGALICIALAILGALLGSRYFAAPDTATGIPPASATLPQQQSSPAASVTPPITEIAATPTTAPTLTEAPSPTSALPAVEIQPYCARYSEPTVFVEIGQPVTLIWYWRATSAALVQEHLDTATYTILLDDEEVLAQTQSEIEYDPTGDPTYPYVVKWSADVGILSAGEHSASRGLYWTREISDGVDTFGPGAEFETLYDTCTIIVE